MSLFFTADTHFGDPRALRFDHRPFADLAAHDAGLIRLWNETVTPDDEVWHLGDFALGPSPARIAEILGALNGRKHLIVGNNDGEATLAAPGWQTIQHYRELEVEERRLVLCHYPFRTWNGIGKGAINLHGHSHGRLKGATRQVDVGVDVWAFRPVTLATILSRRRRGGRSADAGGTAEHS
jgi:calcineurin-like phosphoesterase family protein